MSNHPYGNAAEWLMAAMSVVTLGAVIWQSVLTRQMADDVFVSNLQERQIAACSSAIRAKGVLTGLERAQATRAEAAAVAPATQSTLTDRRMASTAPLIETDKVAGLPAAGQLPSVDFDAARQRAQLVDRTADLTAALFELKIYAGTETSARIDALTAELATLAGVDGWDDGYALMSLGEGDPMDKAQRLFAQIEASCRDAMLGEKRGLL